jgi:hypothetical protein
VAVGWVDPEWPLRLWLKKAWKAGKQYTYANPILICMPLSGISHIGMSSGCGVGVAGRERRGLLLSRRMLRAALL